MALVLRIPVFFVPALGLCVAIGQMNLEQQRKQDLILNEILVVHEMLLFPGGRRQISILIRGSTRRCPYVLCPHCILQKDDHQTASPSQREHLQQLEMNNPPHPQPQDFRDSMMTWRTSEDLDPRTRRRLEKRCSNFCFCGRLAHPFGSCRQLV